MQGLKIVESAFPVTEAVERIVKAIADEGWHLFARIDHSGQARKKGLALRPTELLLLGNPEIGTRLMQDRQMAAIDLPMKVLAWEDGNGRTWIARNGMDWLERRHGLTDKATLLAIDAVLERVCAAARKA